jgi:hypothetical protein
MTNEEENAHARTFALDENAPPRIAERGVGEAMSEI